MAVAVATNVKFARTANLPTVGGPYSFGIKTKITTDTATYQGLIGFGHTTNADAVVDFAWEDPDGGGAMYLNSYEDGTGTFNSYAFGTRPAVGSWFFAAVVVEGSGANQFTAYWSLMADDTWVQPTGHNASTKGQLANAAGLSANTLHFCDLTFGFGNITAEVEQMWCYNRALSLDELKFMKRSVLPVNPTSINFFWPLPTTSVTADFSGNGRNPTVSGTPTAAASGPGSIDLYAPVYGFFSGTSAQNLLPGLLTNAQTFYGPTITRGAVSLTPSLFTNNQTFFAPKVSHGLRPSLFTNTQTFYSPTVTVGGVALTPGLFTNNQTFFAPIVTRGAVELTPDLFTNTQTFFEPTVENVESDEQTLLPPLLTNGQTFYSPTVTRGAVGLTPGLLTNTQTFYGPTLQATYGLVAPLLTNNQTFYAATVTRGAVTLLPALFTNQNTFFAPTVELVTFTQDVQPPLLANDNVFFPATVTGGAQTDDVIHLGNLGWGDGERYRQALQNLHDKIDIARQKKWETATELRNFIDNSINETKDILPTELVAEITEDMSAAMPHGDYSVPVSKSSRSEKASQRRMVQEIQDGLDRVEVLVEQLIQKMQDQDDMEALQVILQAA